jgi:branched-chain amino acid transport system substrate-binding protein
VGRGKATGSSFGTSAPFGSRRNRSRGHRNRTAVLLVGATAVVTASCGARVAPYLGSSADVNQGGQVGAAASGPIGGSALPGTQSASGVDAGSAGGSSNSAQGAAPSLPPPQSFSFDPKSEAQACPGSAGNTASAPGVTATTVTTGNVSGLTGPLFNSFNQGAEAVQALFSAVDAAGGICGRKLQLDVEDDQQDSSTNGADVQDLIPKVLAFTGSTSDGDNGGVPAMVQAGIPDFGFAINCDRSESPTYWSVAGGSCFQPKGTNGPYYIADTSFALAKASGYLPAKMAFLAYSIAISSQAAQQFEYVYQHDFGGTVCYTDFSISPATASLESDVAQMRSSGCGGVLTTLDVTGNAKLLQAMQQQSFTMPYTYTTFDGYTPAQISTAGQSAAQGLVVGLPFVPLNEPNPAVQLYSQELSTYEPGKQESGFGFLSWLAAQMFVYCLIASGHDPTRASLVKEVSSLQNWTAGGATGGYTPSSHGAYQCEVDVTVKGNDFVRKAPSSGLFCGGQVVQASP